MPIRREDKEFIQALSLFGALLGACIGVFAVTHVSNAAQRQHYEHAEYQQTQEALLKLSSTVSETDTPIADEKVLDQVKQQIDNTPAPEPVSKEESFWTEIPYWGYVGICGGGGIVGAMGGYWGIWISGWCGTAFIYSVIRFLYRAVRMVAPKYAAKSNLPVNSGSKENHGYIQRQSGRILPVVVKLLFLLLFILGVLAFVVWQLTAV